MRVRIPSHWWFGKNDFIDADPVVGETGSLLPAGYFIEDILSMELRRPSVEGGPAVVEYIVDLGWYPDQDPSGHYRLTLLGTSWEDVLKTFESRDRVAVRDVLERWLSQIDRARDRAQLERWLKRD